MKNLSIRLNMVVAAGLSIFTVLPVLAPLFAKLGLIAPANIIYWIYQWFCHQRPWRSYHLFDYQYAMDARMMLMFGSMALAAWIIYFRKVKPLRPLSAVILAVAFTFPLAIDGIVQGVAEFISVQQNTLPFYESTNFIRSVTGLLLGTGIGFAIFPYLNQFKGYTTVRAYVGSIIGNLLISFILIFIFVFIWNLTSFKYKPSSLFIDHLQRYPGYNYEITSAGGHITIERIIKEPEEPYIKRAERYGKTEYLNKEQ
ncbi:MAG TPA: DUF2085 domain-containing protein [Candidatus Dojkabacteria bacterium]|nr:DUF2085 domain-containing protein [Candidatus Dojkabacteria bacterium]